MLPSFALFLLFALAGDREGVALDGDLDVLLFHAGHFGADGDFVFVVVNIHGGFPPFKEAGAGKDRERVFEDAIDFTANAAQLIEGG